MKQIFISIKLLLLIVITSNAQNSIMYFMKSGKAIDKQSIEITDVDSIIFYKPPIESKDLDGNTYKTVTINGQVWMAENLKTTRYNDGTAIPLVTLNSGWNNLTSSAFCWYNNDYATYKNIYGALYNRYAVATGKLCPLGWHVPTGEEWTQLTNYLIVNGYNYNGDTISNKLAKALATASGWNTSNSIGTPGKTDYPAKRNASGFSALPGGYRADDGSFIYMGVYATWWNSTEVLMGSIAGCRYLSYELVPLVSDYKSESAGLSVRCKRNN